ncbi:MAG: ABC transporter permease [Deltaproteobacteria bacterium]|nr:ABC transporter permease [Deltaproteobacteria bacterium]
MKISNMAWRNLWRRKRRTYITVLSIGFGVLLSVTFTGMAYDSYTKMIDTSAVMGLGHVTIEPRGYNDSPSLEKRLSDAAGIREQLLEINGVDSALERIMGQAMFASAGKSIGGAFIAVDPDMESVESNLFIRSIVEGGLFSGQNSQGALVGTRVAKKLNIDIGKKLIYTTTDANGEIISEIARVSGIFKTGVSEVDGSMIILPIDRVRSSLGYEAEDATLVSVVVRDQRRSDEMRDIIMSKLRNPAWEALTWRETQADLASIITLDKSGNIIIQVLIGLLIAAGILNTLLMSVMERTREFGVMMAVGMSPFTLFRLVIIESIWYAILGLCLGVLITIPWYAFMYLHGIDFTGMVGSDYSASGVLIDPVMKIRLYRESAAWILTALFTLTILSGIYPAWRAGRVPPVESLKEI